MQVCFLKDAVSLIMPVTPPTYQWSVGKRMETIRIHETGDVYRPGGRARFQGSFDFLLPAQAYPFLEAGARAEPDYYLHYLTAWAEGADPVRFLITETPVNTLVYVEEVTHGERDGTGDRYVTVTLREYAELAAAEVSGSDAGGGNLPGSGTNSGPVGAEQSYTIIRGDTLSMICRRFYGKSTAKYYNALASFNGIKNPHLIYPGVTIQIPTESVLLGVAG